MQDPSVREEQLKMENLKSHTFYEIPRGPILTPSEQRAAVFGVKDVYNLYSTFLVEAETDFLKLSRSRTNICLSEGFFTPSFSMSSVFLW